ncbi:hypothetical protein HanHA89_Chr16g0661141 [Helianthus annuus]|nr:hypothetical protein HanHA89_Chr16g0661141 [Helianthus annuus]
MQTHIEKNILKKLQKHTLPDSSKLQLNAKNKNYKQNQNQTLYYLFFSLFVQGVQTSRGEPELELEHGSLVVSQARDQPVYNLLINILNKHNINNRLF